jgi:hypothetical protein
MAAGLSDRVWTLEEIILMADSYRAEASEARPIQEISGVE